MQRKPSEVYGVCYALIVSMASAFVGRRQSDPTSLISSLTRQNWFLRWTAVSLLHRRDKHATRGATVFCAARDSVCCDLVIMRSCQISKAFGTSSLRRAQPL